MPVEKNLTTILMMPQPYLDVSKLRLNIKKNSCFSCQLFKNFFSTYLGMNYEDKKERRDRVNAIQK